MMKKIKLFNFLPSQVIFKRIVIFIMCFTKLIAQGQNLVPNGSFETYSVCVTDLDQLNRATPWVKPAQGTSDFFNACWTSGPLMADVPTNTCGFQNANTGSGYGGFIPYAGNFPADWREYLQVQLSSSLTSGQQYNVSFYVSFADNYSDAVDGIGLYFSNTAISAANASPLPYVPQITNPAGNVISDMSNWTLISGTYTATGTENYITIGNFKNDASTTISTGVGGMTFFGSYYYIDDVCVTPVGGTGCSFALPINLTSFDAIEKDNKVLLKWSTSGENNNDPFLVERSNDGKIFENTGTAGSSDFRNYSFLDEHPFSGVNYYRLKHIDYDGNSELSKSIMVNNETNISLSILSGLQNDKLSYEFSLSYNTVITTEIVDLLGKILISESQKYFKGINKLDIDIGQLPKGIYYLNIKSETTYSVKMFSKT